MKKISEVYKEAGIDFTLPIEIKDSNDNLTYFENENGFWYREEYDDNGNETYFENKTGYWYRREYDDNRKETYFENSFGFWSYKEYDDNGNETYFETSDGKTRGTKRQSCDGKIVTVDGKDYKLVEVR